MFERFTGPAREAVVLAECEARDLGSDQVGTVHLLLGLLEPADGHAARLLRDNGVSAEAVRARLLVDISPASQFSDEDAAALAGLGIDLREVLSRLEDSLGADALRSGRTPRRGRIGFSRGAKKSLQLAVREAVWLKSGAIGSEHLLLGLLRSDDAELETLLLDLHIDTTALRAATLRSIDTAA